MTPTRAAALAVALLLTLPACGSDDTSSSDTVVDDNVVDDTVVEDTAPPESSAPVDSTPDTTDAPDGVVEVAMTDYSFGDLPDEIIAGTRLTIDNQSPNELHELVALRLADGDERSTDEIVASGLEELLGSGPPSAVLLAAPGGEQIAAVGDGTLTAPGRYLLLCAIPAGADPSEYLAAAATSDGPPQVDGGPPHFVYGMVDEVVVTG